MVALRVVFFHYFSSLCYSLLLRRVIGAVPGGRQSSGAGCEETGNVGFRWKSDDVSEDDCQAVSLRSRGEELVGCAVALLPFFPLSLFFFFFSGEVRARMLLLSCLQHFRRRHC